MTFKPTSINNSSVTVDSLVESVSMEISIIHFCNDRNFIRCGNITFVITKRVPRVVNVDGINTNVHYYMKKQWVKFFLNALPCSSANVFYAFSSFEKK